MATKLSSFFVSHGWHGLSYNNSNERLLTPSRFTPNSCRIRRRKISSQQKRPYTRKVSPQRLELSDSFKSKCDGKTDIGNVTEELVSSSLQDKPIDQANGGESTIESSHLDILPVDQANGGESTTAGSHQDIQPVDQANGGESTTGGSHQDIQSVDQANGGESTTTGLHQDILPVDQASGGESTAAGLHQDILPVDQANGSESESTTTGPHQDILPVDQVNGGESITAGWHQDIPDDQANGGESTITGPLQDIPVDQANSGESTTAGSHQDIPLGQADGGESTIAGSHQVMPVDQANGGESTTESSLQESKLSETISEAAKPLIENVNIDDKISNVGLGDLISMIRNAEKNILLLNQARVRALDDLDKILSEKEALQGEINVLEMRLAETDARIKIAAQEKIHVELLEDHLESLKNKLSDMGDTEGSNNGINGNEDNILNEGTLQLDNSTFHSLKKELSSLRAENMSLKDNVKETSARVLAFETERFSLEVAMKNLESKLSVTQDDLFKLSNLKLECKDLRGNVSNLKVLLDKASKQADQAVAFLQQTHDLQDKVDRLEESLEEAKSYRLSSEKMQQYNELMQQKVILLEERLQKSYEDIHSHVQLYQESVKEFQDILGSLKEESKRRALDGPVDDMPWEFWSRLLLIVDGWLIEKKISSSDAKLLREMVWKRDGRICDAYLTSKDKKDPEMMDTFLRLISSQSSPGLHIIHIAAEMAPVAKVGGLGDVVSGLSKSLQKKGHLVEVVLPKYDCMQYDRIADLRALDVVIESYFDGRLFKNKIWIGTVEGLPVYFIEPHHPDNFFWRGQVYGEHDDFKRFSFFSRAALELLLQAGKKPDIIHCHDWQTAFVAPLYWDLYAPKGLDSARICFTCHNFEYQGSAPASELASCGLDVYQLNRPDRMQDHSAHDRVNPVKGAVVFSNIVTTVSPTYAQEVRTAQGGKGLQATLNSFSKKFVGILNGIDTDAWDPSTDTSLEVQYSADDLQGKAENKEALRKHLKLSSADSFQPLVGCITRLVPQKGVHLIRHAIYRTLELGGQFVLLGSSPVQQIQKEFEGIARHFQNDPNVRLILKYDEALSHSIFAASDMFIVPSIFEPCGLTQMIAMRYGSIPIARKTGGLNDSVFDVDDDTIPVQFRNGFTFLTPDEEGLSNALERAFNYYMKNNQSWKQLVQNNMEIDFSWDSSAEQYVELYHNSLARARAAKRA